MATTHGEALVTGSTDGVGRLVAERLAAQGYVVLVHGRDARRGAEVCDRISAKGGTSHFYAADLSSLAETRRLAEQVRAQHPGLCLLVNNAGIGTASPPGRNVSRDGHELRFAVNYLSGFLLTRLLLPTLRHNAPARIVNVSSLGQQAIDFSDVMLTRGYSGSRAYCQSKLAQILFTFDLARELADSGVTVTCLHPATYMDTTMVRAGGITPTSSVDEGANAIMQLASGEKMAGGTAIFCNGLKPSRADAQAYDEAAIRQLRELSETLARDFL